MMTMMVACRYARQWGLPVVSIDWLEASLAAGRRVDESQYIVTEDWQPHVLSGAEYEPAAALCYLYSP